MIHYENHFTSLSRVEKIQHEFRPYFLSSVKSYDLRQR